MGEAIYYLKAQGCDAKTLEAINAFIKEGHKAEDWWQDHRPLGFGKTNEQLTCDKFWEYFKTNFPTV